MRFFRIILLAILAVFLVINARASVFYVNVNSTNPTPPYSDWSTASTDIQSAIDASSDGDQIWVTNGVYQTGGRVVYGSLTNRVVINKAITVQSVNGPTVTFIVGNPVIADSAIRCVYMTNNSTLLGFTLLNGATRAAGDAVLEQCGGGVYCESNAVAGTNNIVLSNCIFRANAAQFYGAGVYQGVLTSCLFSNNYAGTSYGSGKGGGAYDSALSNCTLLENSAQEYGGGAYGGTINNCFLHDNGALDGGGVAGAFVNNCVISNNGVTGAGGGALYCSLTNCLVISNTAVGEYASPGGGASSCLLESCTVVGNYADGYGGGIDSSTVADNCIIYYNTSGGNSDSNYSIGPGQVITYTCTAPITSGTGNIAAAPLFANPASGNFQLQSNSPCINFGNNANVIDSTDLAGNPRIIAGTVDIGAYEYPVPVPLAVTIEPSITNPTTGFAVGWQSVVVGGSPTFMLWDFGDGTTITNEFSVSHIWATPGIYPVTLTVSNVYTPGGVSATMMFQVFAQPVYYVNAAGTNPVAPYAFWTTAATNIQDAVDASYPGAVVLVTNGIYQHGGRTVYGVLTNRVIINKPVTVQSVNGPAVTVILGYQVPGTTNGNSAVRCVYMTNGATLAGFTLTNGATLAPYSFFNDISGGGVLCDATNGLTVSNCLITGNAALLNGGGSYQGLLINCILSGNTAFGGSGGGVYQGNLANCTVSGNFCLTSIEEVGYGGGGLFISLATNCVIYDNTCTSAYGAGAYGGTLRNCTIIQNTNLSGWGGGLYMANATNCAIAGNSCNTNINGAYVTGRGGGAYGGNLVNCTIVNNCASDGGGTYDANQLNCIIDSNVCTYNPQNYENIDIYAGTGVAWFCCTTPGSIEGITNNPLMVSVSHVATNSPCLAAGYANYVDGLYFLGGNDIDGLPWGSPPSIGCAEIFPGNTTGNISFGALTAVTNQPRGYPMYFQANVFGPVTATVWNFGDGTVVTNQPFINHAWSASGNYPVTLTAYNDTYTNGQSETVMVNVYAPATNYVVSPLTSNQVPVAPYISWASAATNIQSAIAVAQPGDVVLVSNGVYTGSSSYFKGVSYSVIVTNPVTVQSVNGPAVTRIDGGKTGCVCLATNAALVGFTVTNGGTYGGVDCLFTNALVMNCVIISNSNFGANYGILSNCTLTGNSGLASYYATLYDCTVTNNSGIGCYGGTMFNCLVAGNATNGIAYATAMDCKFISNSASSGGGGNRSTMYNCLLIGNNASQQGGGAANYCILDNCTIVGNSAPTNGGVTGDCTLNNCVVYYNTGGNSPGGIMYNCCVTPLPLGPGNFTNAPQFVNGNSDFHLQSNSPCINAGNNTFLSNVFIVDFVLFYPTNLTNDLDGNPRIAGGTVDVGAYEYQTPTSILSYAWAQQYGIPTDGSADFEDMDGTGMNNWQDWIAGLNPTNAASVLQMLNVAATNNPAGLVVTWQSVNTRSYYLQSSTNLLAQPAFITIQSNITGLAGTTSFTDTNATNAGPYFYRVFVEP